MSKKCLFALSGNEFKDEKNFDEILHSIFDEKEIEICTNHEINQCSKILTENENKFEGLKN